MRRRGAISFSSDNKTPAKPRQERRGAVCLNAMESAYLRNLGDLSYSVRTMTRHKKGESNQPLSLVQRSSSINSPPHKMDLEKITKITSGSCNCALCFQTEERIPIPLQSFVKQRSSKRDRHRYRSSYNRSRLPFLGLEDSPSAKVEGTLAQVDHWSFDVFALHHATSGRALSALSTHLFQMHNLLEEFNLDYMKLRKFFDLVEQDYYCGNPYHNGIHAADVTQATHCLLSDNTLNKHFSKLEVMAMLLAAITHDVGHPGVNQDFLISTSSYLASIHPEKKSLLERHHCKTAKALLIQSQLLSHLPSSQFSQILSIMETCILATDMSLHKNFMTRFETLVSAEKRLETMTPTEKTLVCQMLMKCADVSNPCRPWKISQMWSYRIMEEFYRQGDFEKGLGLSVSFLCDRATTSVPKAQSGFIGFVADPMFTLWNHFVGSRLSQNLCRNLDNNKATWDDVMTQLQEFSTDSESEDAACAVSDASADC